MRTALQQHWPEYVMEAAGLGVFMLSACVFATLLQHPASPVAPVIQQPLLQRFLMGLAMALTAISIVYSPWGKQSGAHLNPAVTLTFFRLGKVALWDALWYVIAQFVGGILGVVLAATLLRHGIADPTVNYVITVPGRFGTGVAFVAEVLIAFILMSVVLRVSNNRVLNRFTGLCAGILVATYITLEAPVSGMSMNPARTFGSALSAQVWTALWIYFLAPPFGMLLAAELYVRWHGAHRVLCAKLHHHNTRRCIFHCGYAGTWPGSLARHCESPPVTDPSRLQPHLAGRELLDALTVRRLCLYAILHRSAAAYPFMWRSRDMYRSLYLLCSLALPVLGLAYAARADEASDAAIYRVSYIEVMPSSQGETIAFLRQYREASRKEEGNVRLEVLQQNGRPDHFVLLETWKDQKALDAHGMATHTAQLREKLQPVLVSPFDERLHKGLAIGAALAARAEGATYVVTHADAVPPGKDEALVLLKQLAETSRTDDGNVRFEVLQQSSRQNHCTIVEVWKDQKALAAHVMAGHTRQFREKFQPLSGSLYDERLYTGLD